MELLELLAEATAQTLQFQGCVLPLSALTSCTPMPQLTWMHGCSSFSSWHSFHLVPSPLPILVDGKSTPWLSAKHQAPMGAQLGEVLALCYCLLCRLPSSQPVKAQGPLGLLKYSYHLKYTTLHYWFFLLVFAEIKPQEKDRTCGWNFISAAFSQLSCSPFIIPTLL